MFHDGELVCDDQDAVFRGLRFHNPSTQLDFATLTGRGCLPPSVEVKSFVHIVHDVGLK